jgi:hypothetical protein
MRMRIEAERRANPQPRRQPPGKVDPSKRPTLHSDSGDEIACPEPVEGTQRSTGSPMLPPAGFRSADPRTYEGVNFVNFVGFGAQEHPGDASSTKCLARARTRAR